MKTIRIQLEYKCYPVWIYDNKGLIVDTALPPELADEHALDKRFRAVQERFDATYVDTATEFYNKGFESQKEQDIFESDLKAAVAELAEKCPEGYRLEAASNLI